MNKYHIHDLHPDHLTIPVDIPSMEAGHNNIVQDECKPLSEEDRQRKVHDLRVQLQEYEKPHERLWEMVVGQPSLIAAVKIGLDVNLFELWAEVCGGTLAGEQLTLAELSWLVNIELATMRRVLRHLASYGVIQEVRTEPETYTQTKLSRALCDPSTRAGVLYYYAVCGHLYLQLPEFLRAAEYQATSDPRDGLFQRHKGCKDTVFEYHEKIENHTEAAIFNNFVSSYRTTRIPWTSIYKTQHIIEGYEQGPLLVDIGGSRGDDLEHFRLAHPGNGTQLFLEDMPAVLEKATCDAEIRRIPHNFFEPQPIRGARTYYLHSILHDWNDDDALAILRHVRDAMIPGYSKLLVNDIMMPRHSATRLQTSVDMQMWVMASARERTEDEFGRMFMKAGLDIVKIWRSPLSVTSIVELAVHHY